MPKRLPDRCQPDSVREFRLGAQRRFSEANSLAANDYRTGAIYLWSYVAEMVLKAAYFQAVGFASGQQITIADLKGAKANAPSLGFAWSGSLHSVESWARLLVSARAVNPALQYPDPLFADEIVLNGKRIGQSWIEVLRYHKNIAYPFEVEQVGSAVEWLFHNSLSL